VVFFVGWEGWYVHLLILFGMFLGWEKGRRS
jgi:hypothetical protein